MVRDNIEDLYFFIFFFGQIEDVYLKSKISLYKRKKEVENF